LTVLHHQEVAELNLQIVLVEQHASASGGFTPTRLAPDALAQCDAVLARPEEALPFVLTLDADGLLAVA